MTTLILGSGAREHALGWVLGREPGHRLWFGPGNAGTEALGTNLVLDPLDPTAVVAAARETHADLVVVGPEEPLARGVADALRDRGYPVFGPGREAALLETSKAHAKDFMARHGVPTASSATFRDFEAYRRHIIGAADPVVVKKSGLAAGKGVLVAPDRETALKFGWSVLREDAVLVEELLEGYELSVFVLLDGASHLLLASCADHKKAHDNDQGPNTGGMGAVCPVPVVDEALRVRIERETVEPTLRGLRVDGVDFRGVLFLGLIVTTAGCRVLEYNVRFGDPEAQVLLPALDLDWIDLIGRAATGRLGGVETRESARCCVGVVIASPGYPNRYPRDLPVTFSRSIPEDVLVFHASTRRDAVGGVRTGGGRCFTVVGRGGTLREARDRAYVGVEGVEFPGAWCRRDIGARHLPS